MYYKNFLRVKINCSKFGFQNQCNAFQTYKSKLHSILAEANLHAHNNISQNCHCGQIPLQDPAVNCSFSDNLTPLG